MLKVFHTLSDILDDFLCRRLVGLNQQHVLLNTGQRVHRIPRAQQIIDASDLDYLVAFLKRENVAGAR